MAKTTIYKPKESRSQKQIRKVSPPAVVSVADEQDIDIGTAIREYMHKDKEAPKRTFPHKKDQEEHSSISYTVLLKCH